MVNFEVKNGVLFATIPVLGYAAERPDRKVAIRLSTVDGYIADHNNITVYANGADITIDVEDCETHIDFLKAIDGHWPV